MEALDYQMAEIAKTKGFEKKPSGYFKSNFYACFWFEKKDLSDMLHKVRIDNCLFETDFPHPTSGSRSSTATPTSPNRPTCGPRTPPLY